jgi:hypothetical protein
LLTHRNLEPLVLRSESQGLTRLGVEFLVGCPGVRALGRIEATSLLRLAACTEHEQSDDPNSRYDSES